MVFILFFMSEVPLARGCQDVQKELQRLSDELDLALSHSERGTPVPRLTGPDMLCTGAVTFLCLVLEHAQY